MVCPIVRFIRAGITGALDSHSDEQEEETSDTEYETESDFDVTED